MATRQTGASVRLTLARETVEGTAPTEGYSQVAAVSFDLAASQARGRDRLISAGAGRNQAPSYLEAVTVQGNAQVPIDLHQSGHWLTMLFGVPVSTGGAGNYVHTWKAGGDVLPTYTFERSLPRLPRYGLFTGVKANTLAIDLGINGGADMTVALLGQGEATTTTSIDDTPIVTALRRFQRSQAEVRRNGVKLGSLVGGSFNFTNNLEPVRTIRNDNRLDGVDEGEAGASGQVTVRLANTILLDQAASGEPCELVKEYVINASRSLTFTMHNVEFDRPGIRIPGPGGLDVPFAYDASDAGDGDGMLTVVLRNQTAGY